MAHTHSRILVHVVFSTKGRREQLTVSVRAELWPYMAGIVKACDATCLAINGVADHVHLLLALPPKLAVADLIGKVKANSSKWLNEKRPVIPFAWQQGYGVFSVSQSQEANVREYIAAQEDHHQRMSYHDELLTLLARHGVEFDPRFVVD